MKVIFKNDVKYVNLRMELEYIRNVIYLKFYANLLGSHHDAFRTFQKICQRYFWPDMYQYCRSMIKAYPGCSIGHITMRRSVELVYSFPIYAHVRFLFVDIYAAGTDINFYGNLQHLIADCGMTGFAISESTLDQTAKTLASILIKIWLQFRFYHTIVVNKARSSLNSFVETTALLKIHIPVLSGEKHDPVIVEQIIRFHNSSLNFFNERGTNRFNGEGILMCLNAWNLAPVVATDIYWSLVVVGCDFQLPIMFCTDCHRILTVNPARVTNYAADQERLI